MFLALACAIRDIDDGELCFVRQERGLVRESAAIADKRAVAPDDASASPVGVR